MREWRYSSIILHLFSFMVQTPYPQKMNPQYPLDRRLGGPQRQCECWGKEKNFLLLPGIEPQLSSPQPIAIPTQLFLIAES
jgi:hypothetical protein